MTKEQVLAAVSAIMHVSQDEITGQSKKQRVCRARQMSIFLLCELAGLSEVKAGKVVGGTPHYSRLKADALLEHDSGFREQHRQILDQLAKLNKQAAA